MLHFFAWIGCSVVLIFLMQMYKRFELMEYRIERMTLNHGKDAAA